jgi:hypothetical protein
LARSDGRPAGAVIDWMVEGAVAPRSTWTIFDGTPSQLYKASEAALRSLRNQDFAHRIISRRRAADRNRLRRTLNSASSDLAQHAPHTVARNALDAQQRSEAGRKVKRSGVGGSSSTELRRHHLRQ